MHDRGMKAQAIKLRAYSVHLLTATGAVFAMLAMLAATQGDWPMMFLWLVVAFAVDGVDGPLARKWDVKLNAARIDGSLLDLIIDYLTYVFIPAYALFYSGLLPGLMAWIAPGVITFASAIYFADTNMKTKDNSFSGFPGCWNMLVLVLFATAPPPALTFVLILVLALAMFLPVKFIHPVRTRRWRRLSLPVAMLWTGLAALAAVNGFTSAPWLHWGLTLASLYLLFAGLAQQLIPPRKG